MILKRIIKANTYYPVSSEPFDMPVPLKLELYYTNTLLCVYSIAEDLTVDFSYNTNTEIPMLTPNDRSLKIKDIYYLIRSRVFRDNPYTGPAQLAALGLSEYNPYNILLKTYGIMPMNGYWIKRADKNITYDEAIAEYNALMYGAPPDEGQDTQKSSQGIEDFLG